MAIVTGFKENVTQRSSHCKDLLNDASDYSVVEVQIDKDVPALEFGRRKIVWLSDFVD